VDFLRRADRDSVSDALAIKLIERYGLSFRPTAEEMARLRNAPSAALVVKAVESARLPILPPPKDAALAITCEPVECQIWVDDRAFGQTLGGDSQWLSVRPGKTDIRVESPNYEPLQDRTEVVLLPGERRRIEFRFRPTQEYLNDLGERYLIEMRKALGGSPGKDISLRMAGTLYVRDDGGIVTAWSIVAWSGMDGLSRVEASRLNQKSTFERAETSTWKQSAGRPAAQVAKGISLLDKALRRGYIDSLQSASATLATYENALAREFIATGLDGGYAITLDPLSRPAEIAHEAQGVAAASRYLYSHYSEVAGLFWPNLVEADDSGEKISIAARFSTVRQLPAPGNPPDRSSH
jgi:hypothetical protein